MTRTISFSVRKGLSVLNNDFVEVDLKMDLVKSRDLLIHIKNIHKSSKGCLQKKNGFKDIVPKGGRGSGPNPKIFCMSN